MRMLLAIATAAGLVGCAGFARGASADATAALLGPDLVGVGAVRRRGRMGA